MNTTAPRVFARDSTKSAAATDARCTAIAGRLAHMAIAEGLAHVVINRPIFERDWRILYQVVMIPMALAGGYANTWDLKRTLMLLAPLPIRGVLFTRTRDAYC